MVKKLCKTCVEELKARGKSVKVIAKCTEKFTCAECGRRKYGCEYDVTGRARRKAAL